MKSVIEFLRAHSDTLTAVASAAAVIAVGLLVIALVIRVLRWVAALISAFFRAVGNVLSSFVDACTAFFSLLRAPFLAKEAIKAPLDPSPHYVFKATHFVYLCTFVIGVVISAKALVEYLAPTVTADRMFVFPMLAFAVANCVHQSLIYGDLREAEDIHSKLFRRYDGWWLGTGAEKALRVLVMICLLALAGESPFEKLPDIHHWKAYLPDSNRFVMYANCGFYLLILVWNLAARVRISAHEGAVRKSMENEDAPEVAKKQLNVSIASDGLALLLWVAAVNVNEKRQLFAVIVAALAVLYLVAIVWFRPRIQAREENRDRLERVFFAFTTLAALAFLNITDIKNALESNVENTKVVLEKVVGAVQ